MIQAAYFISFRNLSLEESVSDRSKHPTERLLDVFGKTIKLAGYFTISRRHRALVHWLAHIIFQPLRPTRHPKRMKVAKSFSSSLVPSANMQMLNIK